LRRAEPAVVYGDFTMLLPEDERIYAFMRRFGPVELLVLANFSATTVAAVLPSGDPWEGAELVLGNCAQPDPADGGFQLHEWEARVYRRVRAEGQAAT
jgi:oligo-1,6-glucosidase